MVEIILSSIFVLGVAGAATILVRKMPAAQRVAVTSIELNAANLGQVAKGWCVARIKRMPYFRDFNWVEFLQKMLMRGRVVVLKAENKINDCMLKLRQKAEAEQKKEGQALDNYWHDLKTIVKTKKSGQSPEAGEEAEPIQVMPKVKNTTLPEADNVAAAGVVDEPEAAGPMVSRVVMPEEAANNNRFQFHKKKRSAKKKKFKDPFQW